MEYNIKGKLGMEGEITIFLTKNEFKELKNRKLEGILICEEYTIKTNRKFPLLKGILTYKEVYDTTFPFSLDLLSKAKIYYDGVSIITLPNECPTKYEIKLLNHVYDELERDGSFEMRYPQPDYISEEGGKFRIEIIS